MMKKFKLLLNNPIYSHIQHRFFLKQFDERVNNKPHLIDL